MATAETSKNQEKASICYYYNTPGGCWRDNYCKFEHARDETADTRPMCRFYGTSKKCWYGHDCYFRHVKPDAKKQADPAKKDTKKPSTRNSNKKISSKLPTSKEGKYDNNNNEKNTDVLEKIENSTGEAKKSSDAGSCDKKLDNDAESGDKKSDEGLSNETSDDVNVHDEGAAASPKVMNLDVSCGECGMFFKDGEKGICAHTAIEQHYFEMLGKADREHVKIFTEVDDFTSDHALCGACGRIFRRPEDLLRHLGCKYRVKGEKHNHREYFSEIVHLFVDRDTGLHYEDEDDMVENLGILMMEHCSSNSCSISLNDDFCKCYDDDTMTGYIVHQLEHLGKLTKDDSEDEMEKRAQHYGFLPDEVEELLCQGIKPWDAEAHAALMILHGGLDDSDY